ncbi:MAG: hypothetical protein JXN65_05845 [Clostridia bacterium]|nr:hypothetical protein [Clostridia bacterium]
MSRGMSRGGSGFPIIIAVLGVLILAVIGIFIYMQLSGTDDKALDNTLPTIVPTVESTPIPTVAPVTPEPATEEPVTVPPTTEPTQAVDATTTPYITAPPVGTSGTVWVNVDALQIHTAASFDSDVVGKIPYGISVSGDISADRKWMNTSYEGTSGYIYLKNLSSGRACTVTSESLLQPLDPDPDAPTTNLVQSHTFNESGTTLTLTITFTTGVYSKDDKSGDLALSDFSISTNGTLTNISHVAGSQTAIVTAFIDTASSNYVITLKDQSVFDASGNACSSQTFTQP